MALLSCLVLFRLLPRGFTNRDLRERIAPIYGRELNPGQMSYDLRRLKLHGLIEQIPKTRRYKPKTEWFVNGVAFDDQVCPEQEPAGQA